MPIQLLHVETRPLRNFRRLAAVMAGGSWLLIVLAAVVRISNSGLGCPDWPLCYGGIVPPPQATAWIEQAFRLLAALLAIGGGLLLAQAAKHRRQLHRWTLPLLIPAAILYAGQVGFGALAVAWGIPPFLAWLHTALGMAVFGLLLANAVLAYPAWRTRASQTVRILGEREELHGLAAWLTLATVVAFLLTLTGAYVTRSGAALVCPDFPQCAGTTADLSGLQRIHMLHRIAGFATFGIFLWLTWRYTSPLGQVVRGVRVWTWLMTGLFVLEIGLGYLNVWLQLPAWVRASHLAVAAAIWGGFAGLFTLYQAGRTEQDPSPVTLAPAPEPAPARRWRTVLFTYFWLTKPYITVLLLVTTLGAMLIAAGGWPGTALVFWTLLGGALSASSANTLNAYIERDIDSVMTRTRRRPLPSARIDPRHALIYGISLGVLSIVILAVFANLLSAALSAFAIFYYVVIYTLWLKPRTPHNIVIGGAAGALPPMIGWTAVTGQIDVMALFLFAIVFYWTPPHTWALTLLVYKDYAQAHIPMWPVVRGEADTRSKILLYTVLMLAITIIPAGLRLLGPVYLVAALVLGGIFFLLAWRLYRGATKAQAMSLYKYSTLYLALLFVFMVVDQAVMA
jgi:protoheme IX farnesyltransferase